MPLESRPPAPAPAAASSPSPQAIVTLEKELAATRAKLDVLDAAVVAASQQLEDHSYPAKLIDVLRANPIDFDATHLDGLQVTLLPKKLLRALLDYTAGVQEMGRSQQSLANILEIARAPIEKAWREQNEPTVGFSVVLRPDEKQGRIAELVPNKDPPALSATLPATYPILTLEGHRIVEKVGTRWSKGPPPARSVTAVIPVAPASVAAFTSEILLAKMAKALFDFRSRLEGDAGDPQGGPPGLLVQGGTLVHDLHALQR